MKTSNEYEVTGPGKDGEIDVEVWNCEYAWFCRDDLVKMLAMFDDQEASNEN